MTISDSEKIDFLWKKVIYGVSKTANGLVKSGSNEVVPSPTVTYSSDIWTQGSTIPATPPASNTSTVAVYYGANAIQLTANPTSPAGVSWLSNMTNFIPTTFGPSYLVQVYCGNPNSGGVRQFPDTVGYEYVFDYVSGSLNFDNGIPAAITNGVYIQAYQYIGMTLDQNLANISSTASSSSKTTVVANIAARNALTPNSGDIAHVLDASGDPANAGPGQFADYLWTGSSWQVIATENSARADAATQSLVISNIDFANASEVVGMVGSNTRVVEVSINVTTPFDQNADLTIGDSGNTSRLVDSTDVDLSTSGVYVIQPYYQFPANSDTSVSAYYSNSPTVGNATITITWA
jgi:hypothetical protein